MKPGKKFFILSTEATVGAGLASLLGLCCLLVFGPALTDLSYDLLFALKPTVVPNEVVVVYMDDDSHKNLKQPWFQAWDRSLHARLLERLMACGTRAAVFDILFDLPNTNNPAGDEQLIRAAKAHGHVIVAGKVDPVVMNGEVIGWKPTPPFDELRKVTEWGLVEAGAADGVIRTHFAGSERVRSLSWTAAHLTIQALADPSKERWLNYYGPPGTIPWLSYHQVLEPDSVPASVLSNKVVFVGPQFNVGFTGGRGTDDFRTPYSYFTGRRSPGVEVNATAYLNLIRGDWLRRLPPVAELLIVLFVGVLSGISLTGLRPTLAFGLGTGAMIGAFFATGFLTWKCQVWFPWLIVSAVQIPTGLLCSLIANTRRLHREKIGLERSLSAAKSGASAPMVQFSVTSPSAVLPGSSFAIDVWAHLEGQREEVLRRAREQEGDTELVCLPRRDQDAHQGVKLFVRLSLFGLTLRNQEETLRWSGNISKTSFVVEAPENATLGLKTGLANVYVEGLKVATLHFSLNVDASQAASTRVTSQTNRPRRAFACYARADRTEVLARVQGMQKAIPGLEVFMDVHSLRSGQNWEEELRKAIVSSDIFYLFWSENARASKEVEKEWRFALEQKGRDFIDPVPLASSDEVMPPDELTGKHFNDWTLAFERERGNKKH